MLEVGNGGMIKDEYVVHFSIWVISKALFNLLDALLYMKCAILGSPSSWLRCEEYHKRYHGDHPLGVQAKKVRSLGDLEEKDSASALLIRYNI
ncbi:hypothetical protein DVH24_007730 [Malus domestica]|uniref:Uncharacterized protein n=1 Tax=Malus domestica TaxID=3750 RepID=A0A498HJH5_MALDO|nr:hypothetical protein DVH24_007730 [Malus domestica]